MEINIFAVLVAVIASFIVGWLWFSPILFGKMFLELIGMTPEKMQAYKDSGKNPMMEYMMTVAGAIITGLVIAVLFNYANIDTPTEALSSALLIWIGIVMPLTFNDVLFGGKAKKLWLLTGGHQLAQLLVMAYVIALWK